MSILYIKTNRIFNPVRKYAWTFLLIVAIGGLWYHKLGLLLIPVMLTLAVLGFFKGKYWCGNFCPHGSLFDSVLLPFSANKRFGKFFTSKITVTLAFGFFSYMMTVRFIKVFAIFPSISFIDKLGFIFVMNYLVVTIVGSMLAIFINSRAWCTICPMGTMQVLFYKLGKWTKLNEKLDSKVAIRDIDKCRLCGKCSSVCPMQLTPHKEFSDNSMFENEQCILCSTCINNCPANILCIKKL